MQYNASRIKVFSNGFLDDIICYYRPDWWIKTTMRSIWISVSELTSTLKRHSFPKNFLTIYSLVLQVGKNKLVA